MLTRHRPSTAATRFKGLRIFLAWLRDEGEITASPMRNMKPPIVPEEPPDVLRRRRGAAAAQDLLGLDVRGPARLRHHPALRLTGMRRAELATLHVSDIDWDRRAALVAAASGYPALVAVSGTAPLFSISGTPPLSFIDLAAAAALDITAGIPARTFAWLLASATGT